MTNNAPSTNGDALAPHPGSPELRMVGSANPYRVQSGHEDRPLPRWIVYGLIAFYCAAAWSLAFWIVSKLL